ncbi:MAG: LacI family DNA-binding transcriptional regulator [Kiritimatiellae bacterium]|nr:LacI family DNA-binding transcriptional regulator [Kiritimatiellia bacterium]
MLRWLERALAAGDFPPGRELPSERAIAKLLGVAPNTAAAAMDEAERAGLAVRRAGSRKRYAGEVRKTGGALASSTIYVLATMRHYLDIAMAPGWSDDFLALDVAQRISIAGRPVSLLNSNSLPASTLDAIFESRPGAMVVLDSVNLESTAMRALERCRAEGIPAIAYGNAPQLRGYDRAYSDHRGGSRDLARWLLARGCRRIVPFFPFATSAFWESERLEGYAEAMREAGLVPHPVVNLGFPRFDDEQNEEEFRIQRALAVSALLALKRDGAFPDALLCREDFTARAALAAVADFGLEPNRDIVVAGYDNSGRTTGRKANFPLRPAVTVDKHNERAAEALAALAVARLDGALPPEPQARIHKHEIVELVD